MSISPVAKFTSDEEYPREGDGRGRDGCPHRDIYARYIGGDMNESNKGGASCGFPAEYLVNDIGWARWKLWPSCIRHCRRRRVGRCAEPPGGSN